MRKRATGIFLLTALACLISVVPAHSADMDAYRKTGVTVAISPQWEPYSFLSYDEKPAGILVDLWELWSEKTGIPVEFKVAIWAETLRRVGNGKIDIHSGLYYNDERAEFLDYANPFLDSQAALIKRKDYEKDCADIFSESSFAVLKGTHEGYYLRTEHPETQYIEIDTTNELLKTLMSGQVDGVVIEHVSVLLNAREMGILNDIEICEILYARKLHAAVQKGNKQLVEIIKHGYELISEDEIRQIKRRWIIMEEKGDNDFISYPVVAAVLVFMAICLCYLLKTVFHRTKK